MWGFDLEQRAGGLHAVPQPDARRTAWHRWAAARPLLFASRIADRPDDGLCPHREHRAVLDRARR
jgi:hypothetical protein